ncbi:MAG: ligase-associated DNA damage response DEXH box helicase [Gammaproteobacteria bacterium]|nr:ligase-associated DNA damage response DEXH box helicase [Gammaproteobacteria bacterium]
MATLLPDNFQQWFDNKEWQVRTHQLKLCRAFENKHSTLLIAPTGAGKTLAGFLPSLIDLNKNPQKGLHTLYVSPLKALTHDIHRNLMSPINEMQLGVTVETRTGDTPSSKRQRQRRNPPNILLTTPESLMLMLSYSDADNIFAKIKCVVIDEVHSFAHSKRGDFTSLALAHLQSMAPNLTRFGLSATVDEPGSMAMWLGVSGQPLNTIIVKSQTQPIVRLLQTRNPIPFTGFVAKYAMPEIYQAIADAQTTFVFVNTRAQAELVFQFLWQENVKGLPIAIYHGSLSKEQRHQTEQLMAKGKVRAVVATSALELGIDWGDVDQVIQLGAPKGVSRLLQRIGRSNHRMDEPSKAFLVPANKFEVLECMCAKRSISARQLDGEELLPGSPDIIPQFIVNLACQSSIDPDEVFALVKSATPYRELTKAMFNDLFQFTLNGGYALQSYERYQRLKKMPDGRFRPSDQRTMRRHRQNIGTIVEAGRLKVKRLRRSHQGKIIGEVEEYFAQQLVPGDTFLFAGEVLEFVGIQDMILEAKPNNKGEPKVPSYVGGQMPLSTHLSEMVRALINDQTKWRGLPKEIKQWLLNQKAFSQLPTAGRLLVEKFPFRCHFASMFYTFEGRKANQTLGMLLTKRMERMKLKPLSFSITDYGLSILSICALEEHHFSSLFSPDILGDDLEDWMMESPMLKRSFRRVAMVSGLTEQNYASTRKNLRQVTFSTDLIFDVLRKYDPDHVLLKVARQDAERELLDLSRLSHLLIRFHDNVDFHLLTKPSPLSIPIILDVRSEQVKGTGIAALIGQLNLQQEAEQLMEDVLNDLA